MLGSRREEILDSLPADVVGFFVARCSLLHVFSFTVLRVGGGSFAVGVEEGLGAGGVG